MIEPKYQWQRLADDAKAQMQDLIDNYDVPEVMATYLAQIDQAEPEKAQRFLNPSVEDFADPFLMPGMQAAVARLLQAIEAGEQIVVYGDYDVDGMTSTAIMTWALELMGANVTYFVPNRFEQGYGPNQAKYEELAAAGMQLLVTVDNGVTAVDEVAWLAEQGIDTIITDHHELPEALPEAVAIVHPRLPDSEYPFGGLSGAGVAFKVASALLEAPADEMVDLAALGTVADVMELQGENRAIVALGLEQIREDARPGVAALLEQAKVSPAQVDAMTIGFGLGPRLNSIGRLGDPTMGVELLLADEPEVAVPLAEKADQLNQERKTLVDDITEAALAQADPEARVTVVAGPDWHEGVLGIVASRLVDALQKPAIVLGETENGLKGSGRSFAAFDLYAGMQAVPELFTKFGGHAGAAGMSLPVENLAALQVAMNEAAEAQGLTTSYQEPLMVTGTLTGQSINRETFELIQQLAPFGQGNPEPMFEVAVTGIRNPKTMSDGKHIRFTAETVAGDFPVVGFGFGHLLADLSGRLSGLKLVGSLSANEFRGVTTYQMMLKDLQAEAVAVLDWRTTKLTAQTLSEPATYVVFDEKLYGQVQGKMGPQARVVTFDDVFNLTHVGTLALLDLPNSLDQLAEVVQVVPAERLAPIFFVKKPVYLQKAPTKADYKQVYQFVQANTNVNLSGQFQQVANHLQMAPDLLVLIFKVFSEANFVTIENGFLNPVPQPATVDLEKTDAYQSFLTQRELEQQLIYSSTAELEQLLAQLSKQEN